MLLKDFREPLLFGLEIVHEIRKKIVHESMPEDYVFKEKIWGKYQYH